MRRVRHGRVPRIPSLGRRGQDDPSSEQFLYWAAKESDGNPDGEGTTLAAARKALKSRGACSNATWAYESMPGATEGQGPPPAAAVAEARKSRWSKTQDQSPGDLPGFRSLLDEGRPVVLGVRTFSNWDFP